MSVVLGASFFRGHWGVALSKRIMLVGMLSIAAVGAWLYAQSRTTSDDGRPAHFSSVAPQPQAKTVSKNMQPDRVRPAPCRTRCRRLEGKARRRCMTGCESRARYFDCLAACQQDQTKNATQCAAQCDEARKAPKGMPAPAKQGGGGP